MPGEEGKGDKGCVGAFWDGVVSERMSLNYMVYQYDGKEFLLDLQEKSLQVM